MRLLEELDRHAQNAVEQAELDQAAKYQDARTAALLAFFFGLRVSETVRLTLSDMVLDSTEPYLWIGSSRRGRSRRVSAQHVPPRVLEELKQARDSLFKETNDPSVPLLVGAGEPAIDANMRHASTLTTVGSYLHAFDYLQWQQLNAYWQQRLYTQSSQ
jgi:integrase